jgi:hypothetical protein
LKTFYDVEQTARVLHCSAWSVRDRARRGVIPHRVPCGTRRILIPPDELQQWIDGAQLEVVEANGGRVVRPRRET